MSIRTARSITYDEPSKSNRSKGSKNLFELGGTPVLIKDFNLPSNNHQSNDYYISQSTLPLSAKQVSWSTTQSTVKSTLRPLSMSGRQQNIPLFSNSASPQKQINNNSFTHQPKNMNISLRGIPSFQTQPQTPQKNDFVLNNLSKTAKYESKLQQPYSLKHYNRKQQLILKDLRKRFGKANIISSLGESLPVANVSHQDDQDNPSDDFNNNRRQSTQGAKNSKEVMPQKISMTELNMMSETVRTNSFLKKHSPVKWSPELTHTRVLNKNRIFEEEQNNQFNPFIKLQPVLDKYNGPGAQSLNKSAQQKNENQTEFYSTDDRLVKDDHSNSNQSNIDSYRSMVNNPAPTRPQLNKLVAVKKPVKDELDKDVIKKIIEKVEKLLIEKEESVQNEKEEKQIGGINSTVNNQVEKSDEQVQPELNFNQHLREIVDVNEHKSTQDSAYASFLKGVGRMKNNKDKSAITAFKQALNFDKAHFATIYNLSCLYERNNFLKIAEQWLDVAALFKKNSNDVNYGFAVIYYKSHRYEDAFRKIDALIIELDKINEENERLKEEEGEGSENSEGEEGDEDDEMLIKQTHQYLRSLCAKKLGQKASEKPEDKALLKQLSLMEDQARPSSPNKIKKSSRGFQIMSSSYQDQQANQFEEKKEVPLYIMPTSQQYYKKASEDYKAFIQYTCPKNFDLFKHFMFAMVFKKIRKMEIKFPPHIQCEFYSLVNQILAAETYTPALEPIIEQEQLAIDRGLTEQVIIRPPTANSGGKHIQKQPPLIQSGQGLQLSLLPRRKDEILSRIQELSFFKRFSPQTIAEFLPHLELRYIQKDELLFAKKQQVFIITGGYLTVFDHSKQFNQPDIVAYYSEGDIIGCDDKDNKISFNPDIWFLSITRVEYVAIDEGQFAELWNLQNQHANRQVLSFIRQIDLFDKVSQLTLYRLAFELLEERMFQNSDIVYNDGESVQKYNYIELYKEDPKTVRNLRNRINNKIGILPLMQQSIDGFFLIQEGTLKLSTLQDWQNYTLRKYNFIGENLLFPTLSISRFGQIVCSSPSTKCLFLSRYEFHKISSLDKGVMKQNVLKSQYYQNCQKILYKYYKFYKIDDFDQPSSIINP